MLDTGAERRQRARNRLHEAVLSAGLVALTAAVAWLLLGPVGLLLLPLPLALVLLVRPRIPVGAVLSTYGARPLPPYAAPGLHRAVAVLARRAGLPRPPALFLVTSPVPNAFTVGRRDDAALAITDGLLALLGGAELLGVLAHEISHLQSGDTSVIGFSRSLGRLARVLVPVGLLVLLVGAPLAVSGAAGPLALGAAIVLLPFAVTALETAFARSRELDADLGAARLTGDPEALARALEVLDVAADQGWLRLLVPGRRAADPWILRTHPATEERVRRLRALAPAPAPTEPPW